MSFALENAEGMAGVLDSLEEGLWEGLIREVCLFGEFTAQDRAIADAAGLSLAAGIGEAAAASQGRWLVILPRGTMMAEGWAAVALQALRNGDADFRLPADGDATVWARRRWAG